MTIDIALKGPVGRLAIDAAFEVPASGITVIWGPSGSGKTTLLRAVAGLQRLSGHVRIGDAAWQDGRDFVPVHKRKLGFVFQEPSLFPHLGVWENAQYGFKRANGRLRPTLQKNSFEVAAADAIRSTRLLHVLLGDLVERQSVLNLSGGERQRVAFARALMSMPSLLLMDEPLSSLDTDAKAELLLLIKQIGVHVPILYVTHDAAEVAALADRVLHMADGRVAPGTKTASLEGLSEAEIRALAEAALRAGLKA
jgi:molybdate transport system ATP-binding protein